MSTTAGDVELEIPKLRTRVSFFPSLLERRRRIDRALFAVVMEAYVHGVSTRKVDDLVKRPGRRVGDLQVRGVSRICAELDGDLDAFRTRPLDHVEFPYVFADATYVKGRVNGRVVSRAVVVATGVTATGDREVLGVDVGDSEDGAFWTAFLQGPARPRPRRRAARDLRPPPRPQGRDRSRCSSARPGNAAGCTSCATSWPGSPRPRPRWSPPRSARSSPSPTPPTSAPSSTRSPRMLAGQFPDVAAMLTDAAEDLLAFTGFPQAHWRKIWSTNPLERLNGEIKRRTNVVGHLPQRRLRRSASSPPSSSRPTTNGPSPNAATSPKNPWPSSRRARHRHPTEEPPLAITA